MFDQDQTPRVFDRLVEYDDKSESFPIRTLLGANSRGVVRPLRSYTWRFIQLDQGAQGACAGFTATTCAGARPKPVFGDPREWSGNVADLNLTAQRCYKRAQELDEWPGNSYDGTSLIAAMKAGQEVGWWNEYRWALGPGPEAAAMDVCLSLGYLGPVCFASNWYEGMNDSHNGWLHPTGRILGGHAYCFTAYSSIKHAVWTPNSWGGFGQGWVNFADLVTLLDNDGEAAIPMRTIPIVT